MSCPACLGTTVLNPTNGFYASCPLCKDTPGRFSGRLDSVNRNSLSFIFTADEIAAIERRLSWGMER